MVDKTSTERRYFISSLDGSSTELFASAVRGHWGIENGLHWVLDLAFREKVGVVANKRLMTGRNDAYLMKVLTGG